VPTDFHITAVTTAVCPLDHCYVYIRGVLKNLFAKASLNNVGQQSLLGLGQ